MNWPPLLLHLRVPSNEGFVGLWLPWFLLYPVLLALMLVVLPFVFLAILFLLPAGKAEPLIWGGPYLWRLLFSMRGLRVEVNTGGRRMMLDFV